MRKLFLLLLLLFAHAVGFSQVIRTYAFPDTVSIGDTFSYVITAQYTNTNLSLVFPDKDSFEGDFELQSIERLRGVNVRDSVIYKVQFFALNDTIIPPKSVRFTTNNETGEVLTAPVPLYFRSSLVDGVSDLQPLKPNFFYSKSFWGLILLGLALALIAYLIWRNKDRFKSKPKPVVEKPIEIPPYVNPLKILDSAIANLKSTKLDTPAAIKEFYFEISIAVRRYFEDTYKINALESTTREVLNDLSRIETDESLQSLTSTILKECDFVKFAKVERSKDEAKLSLRKLEEFRALVRQVDAQKYMQLKTEYEIAHGLRPIEPSSKKSPVLNPLVENSNSETL
jgi:hypothetical protein